MIPYNIQSKFLPMMRTTVLSTCILIVSVFFSNQIAAQNILITNGEITTCDGSFVDDGDGGSYTNADYTFTICPDVPGDVIQIQFSAFQLFTSPNPNNSDYLSIYDGNTTGANSLGNYTGNSLQGLPVTGTVNNTTGCLTFVFNVSNSSSGTNPGWEGLISCTTPCDPPTSVGTIIEPEPQGPEQSIGVCLNQEITFGDLGSTAAPGFNIQYWIWNWNDGTIDTLLTPADITHAYTEPGEYIVNLSVEDNNGCRSMNLDPLQILVSTIPLFNTDFDSPVCLDEPTVIDGSALQSVTWTALPPQVVAGETYLADGAGFSYSSTLTFDFFEPGAELESCDDFLALNVNMEHSYLGDLQVNIECPDGTSILLLPFPNGGGGTFLGEAIDDNSNDPGIGYDYGWAPGLTNGNLDDQTLLPFPGTQGIVPPGLYQSEEDMCNLVGCPLNGDWTISILDNLGADNGYIFEWGIDFNPILFPDVTTFTPVVGLELDSSYWEGPNVISTSENGNIITTEYTTPGAYDYTFYATNNFGCTFDTTITIQAIEGPEITAGPDLQVCQEPVTLQAGMGGANPPVCGQESGNFDVCYGNNENLVFTYCPDNPGDGITFMAINFNSGSFDNWGDQINIYDGDDATAPLIESIDVFDLSGLSYQASNASGCITMEIISGNFDSCADGWYEVINYDVNCTDADLIWSWSPATGLSDPNIQNPTALVQQATLYTVTAYPAGLPGCVITDQVLVAPDPTADPGIDNDTTFCYNSALSNLTNYLDGNPAPGGSWINLANNETVPNLFNPTQFPDGANFTFQYTISNGQCEGTSELNITILPSTNNTCCQTNADAGPDAVACDLTYQLSGSIPIGSGSWSGPDNVSFSNINDRNAVATYNGAGGGTAVLTWTDANGAFCEVGSDVEIIFSDPVELALVPSDVACYNECTGMAIVIPDGGTVNNAVYNIIWSDGVSGNFPAMQDSLCAGFHTVKVTDNFGCADSLEFEIDQPAAQNISVQISGPSCADQCDAQIKILSEGAINYSFDDQETWGANHIGLKCAGPDTVYARNAAGCVIAQPVDIINPTRFEANFNVNPTTTTTKNTLVTFQDVSEPGPLESSLFTIGDDPILKEIDQRFISFRFPSDTSGTYPIQLISTSIKGCQDTIIKMFEIRDDLLWYIPNSFSPNEDGINDIWRPVGNELDITDYRLSIYDRWGKQVFFTTDFTKGWNGSVAGSDYYSDAAVFTYLIKVTSATTKDKYEFTGSITLIR